MIDATRRSIGFPTSRVTSQAKEARGTEAPKKQNAPGSNAEAAAGAAQVLSNNPSLLALRGQSGFDGVKSQDTSAKITGQSSKSSMPQLDYRNMILSSMVRRRGDDSDLDSLKRRIASLIIALGKDDPLPKHGSSTNKVRKTQSPAAAQQKAAAQATGNAPRPTNGKEGPKNTTPVQPNLGEVEPLERVLQVLQGILKAVEDSRGGAA